MEGSEVAMVGFVLEGNRRSASVWPNLQCLSNDGHKYQFCMILIPPRWIVIRQ